MRDKTKLIGTILGVVLFIALIAGFTYAYLISRVEKTLTTGSGKFSIDYQIVENITAEGLTPSDSKDEGLHGKVTAKLSEGSIKGKFNIYITPSVIEGLNTSDALKYEVYVNNSTTPYKTGDFNNAAVNNPLQIVDSYELNSSTTLTTFDIYIWLDNNKVTNAMFGKTFKATISADSTSITGDL